MGKLKQMVILAIRTDRPQAEIYLFDDKKELATTKWQAHLQLAETLNAKIEEILNKSSISYKDVEGIAIFKGPGSFTGLRIGSAVANALAYSQNIPIVSKSGDSWLQEAVAGLMAGKNDKIAVPKYGSAAHITQPRK
jgi:tRNA threonylcarbamoyladenosine biosynthesis protein TsaB